MDQKIKAAPAPVAPPPATDEATMPPAKPKVKEHWLVEVAGGTTLGATIMAGLALWTLVLAQTLMS